MAIIAQKRKLITAPGEMESLIIKDTDIKGDVIVSVEET